MQLRNTDGYIPRHFCTDAEVKALLTTGNALGALAARVASLWRRWHDGDGAHAGAAPQH